MSLKEFQLRMLMDATGKDFPPQRLVIVGAGFAGLNLAKGLVNDPRFDITLIDRRNHHLFQPLLYQVATCGLSPADIARPIRQIFRKARNVRVLLATVKGVDTAAKRLSTDSGPVEYDRLVLACGARHSYFGRDEWEDFAPGLKTLSQATEMRRRILLAFEQAEREEDPRRRQAHLSFVVVGGGPTGVELAGAIGELARHTLKQDFRRIDPAEAKILLVEAGPRILPMFEESLAAQAQRQLAELGVETLAGSPVSAIDAEGVEIGGRRLPARTVLWAAGVQASKLGQWLDGAATDRAGRVKIDEFLAVPGHPEIHVLGDMAFCPDPARVDKDGQVMPLPGVAPVAMQQGRYLARQLRRRAEGLAPEPFAYVDKGSMATIGRSRAICQVRGFKSAGLIAWFAWMFIHVYYLVGFSNRLGIISKWTWNYLTYRKSARLIIGKSWRFGKAREIAHAE
ncbi:MAG: hypothetical protein RL095_702 [Verrucomicrobiota bacterium]|jgi:NADH dehydrogenase